MAIPPSGSFDAMICVLAGGVGAAKLLAGLQLVYPAEQITAIVNVGDDLVLHGLHISPDIDTVTYTLAGAIDPERGWGLANETWQAMETLGRLGGSNWFNLGDRDLGTHLYRTQRLVAGDTLDEVTRAIAAGWGVDVNLLPVTNDELRTRVTITETVSTSESPTSPPPAPNGEVIEHEVSFQEYFVQRQHAVPVTAVRFVGAETCHPAPGVLDAIRDAELVIIAPSNPIVSIAPLLAVPGIRDAVKARRSDCIAVSPIIAGAALKGPADHMLTELGHDASVVGVARLYRDLAATLVIDDADANLASEVAAAGMEPSVTPTIMKGPDESAALCRAILQMGTA